MSHSFKNGVCVTCGVSQVAAEGFGWACKSSEDSSRKSSSDRKRGRKKQSDSFSGHRFVNDVCQACGVTRNAADSFGWKCSGGSGGDQHDQQSEGAKDASLPSSSDDMVRFGRVLELKGKVTIDDIKRRWRELSNQYHPDKVAHLGPKLRRVAEEEMKAINEAYEFFREKHDAGEHKEPKKAHTASKPKKETQIFYDETGRGYRYVNGHRIYLDGKPESDGDSHAAAKDTSFAGGFGIPSEDDPSNRHTRNDISSQDEEDSSRGDQFQDVLHAFVQFSQTNDTDAFGDNLERLIAAALELAHSYPDFNKAFMSKLQKHLEKCYKWHHRHLALQQRIRQFEKESEMDIFDYIRPFVASGRSDKERALSKEETAIKRERVSCSNLAKTILRDREYLVFQARTLLEQESR